MGRQRREWLIMDSMNDRVVDFSDNTAWQLKTKISEKGWEGSPTREDEDWQPSEAHAVYECEQIRGLHPGSMAIIKVRIEVPHKMPPIEDPTERAKYASGGRLNWATEQEIEALEKVTAAGCSVTPHLLAVKRDLQDESIMDWGYLKWWMPGGYIVYILMTKLPAQPLDLNCFWNPKLFNAQDRHEIRQSFREAYIEVRTLGVKCFDSKLENLMWDPKGKKCYIVDLEDTEYDPNVPNPVPFSDNTYFAWNLARRWGEPGW